ncbi:hypothetical protein SUGI_0037880 [Cryptomeria japonica]|nr:hypothetical protein SUGI_0037880 [Cryptomeria japonica]
MAEKRVKEVAFRKSLVVMVVVGVAENREEEEEYQKSLVVMEVVGRKVEEGAKTLALGEGALGATVGAEMQRSVEGMEEMYDTDAEMEEREEMDSYKNDDVGEDWGLWDFSSWKGKGMDGCTSQCILPP